MRTIVVQWIFDRNIQYGKEMRVVESDHPRFRPGNRFDYGFFDIATSEGYSIISLSAGQPPVREDYLEDLWMPLDDDAPF